MHLGECKCVRWKIVDVDDLPEALESAFEYACKNGADFRTESVRISLSMFAQPGIFAVIRSLFEPFACPHCSSTNFERHGVRRRGGSGIQQFRCRRPHKLTRYVERVGELSGAKFFGWKTKGHLFNEYKNTLLEGTSLTAREWLAIWYWRTEESPLTYTEIAARSGMTPSSVRRCALERMTFARTRRSTGREHRVRFAPQRLFTSNRWRHLPIRVESPHASCGADELILAIDSHEHCSHSFKIPAGDVIEPHQRVRVDQPNSAPHGPETPDELLEDIEIEGPDVDGDLDDLDSRPPDDFVP